MFSIIYFCERAVQSFSEHFYHVIDDLGGLFQYLEMYTRSIEDPAGFWSDIASEFYWQKKWGQEVCSQNLDVTKGRINIEVSKCLVLQIPVLLPYIIHNHI